MAYTGVLRRETAGEIHGWACDYCGLKAETLKRQPPEEWRDTRGTNFRIATLTYTTSATLCTKRCVALWANEPWPPVKDEVSC